jgi:1-aminocyclopropane-1-carboxylate deaminase/D-cysteine desulfhydrase-like pyridoxal-dependent ACC family enzyme
MRGHEFTADTTYVSKSGARSCRTCLAANAAEKRGLDREGFLQSQRDYYAENAEVLRAKKRAYDQANREEKNRKRRERHRLMKSSPPVQT